MTSSPKPICLATQKKYLSEVPPTQRPLVNKPPTSEKVLEVSFLRTKKKENKSQTPHAQFPENQKGRGSCFLCPISGEKKNGQEKERVFLTQHSAYEQSYGKQSTSDNTVSRVSV
ncbi:hypothetical protein AVEN_118641-1 [Araneus ventricosus]|uniref:Uncharacterized protein n=1 Tax=Araneus ventricosus TaxID=182803 RepID=A0A4Y2AWZ5_ARAVE|nr:hypothetical protein AVEN_118641-1 [Araneus ventricosus]